MILLMLICGLFAITAVVVPLIFFIRRVIADKLAGNPVSLPATPKKAARRNKILLSIVAGLIAISLVSGIAVFRFDQARRAEIAAAEDRLNTALVDLALSPATHLKGWAYGSDGASHTIEADINNDGSMLATVSVGDSKVEVMVVEEQTFIRADRVFWQQRGVDTETFPDYAIQWVKVPSDTLGLDLYHILDLVFLPLDPEDSAQPFKLQVGEKLTLNGTPVQALHTPDTTIYLTQAEPQRILRVESSQRQGKQLNLGLIALAASPQNPEVFQLDMSVVTEGQKKSLENEWKRNIEKLDAAIDAQVHVELSGNGVLNPCSLTSCTANITLRNTVDHDNPYVQAGLPIQLDVTITMTLDGEQVGRCKELRKVQPNQSMEVHCLATYPAVQSERSWIEAEWTAYARPVSADERARMVEKLRAHQVPEKKVEMPQGVTAQRAGQLVENPIREQLEKYYGVKFREKKPQATGPDLVLDNTVVNLKKLPFDIAEIKKLNRRGISDFKKQIKNWGAKGWQGGPDSFKGKVGLFCYDAKGNIYLFGIYDVP